MYPSSILRGFGAVLFTSILASTAPGQTVLFFDTFDPVSPVPDPGCDNSVGGSIPSQWLTQPDQINGFLTQRLFSSDKCHRKNHTGPITEGGSAFEVDSNPYPFAMFRSFDEQTGTLRVSAWVWDDVESRKPQFWPDNVRIAGMVGLTSDRGEPSVSVGPCSGQPNVFATYEDYAFIGVEAYIPSNKPDVNDPNFDPYDPAVASQYCYSWYTKEDGWNLTLDPNTGNPVPRRVDFRNPAIISQTWRHVEIEIRPYTGQVGDIKFYIDGVLVGEGRRSPGQNFAGVPFRRVQLGTRFATADDANNCRPPYSYEHFWFDDVMLTHTPAAPPCNEVRFDRDGDGDVDLEDFAEFQLCYTGPSGAGYDFANCRCFNADGDADIDGQDFAAFQACATRAGIAADPACDDALPPP